jgi:signal transduction histidine kinase
VPIPDSVALAAYFVVAEALANVAKHASATEASVVLEHDGAELFVTVHDNGIGGARLEPGAGLVGLRDRLDALDATLAIDSPPRGGTTVRADFRCVS